MVAARSSAAMMSLSSGLSSSSFAALISSCTPSFGPSGGRRGGEEGDHGGGGEGGEADVLVQGHRAEFHSLGPAVKSKGFANEVPYASLANEPPLQAATTSPLF